MATSTLYSHQGRVSLTMPVYILTYLLMAVTGLGYLALTWSTVVLLGGFVTSLQRKDFWCLTAISMMQAARIFNDLGEKLAKKVLQLLNRLSCNAFFAFWGWLAAHMFGELIFSTIVFLPWLLFLAVCYIVVFLYVYGGPIACIALALWRIVQRDYGSNDGDVTKANLAPALDLFYGLILCQGALYMIWLIFNIMLALLTVSAHRNYKMPRKSGYIWLVDYLVDTRTKCWRDTASIEGRTISHYAVDLTDSKSWDDQLYGMRMLATFIKQGADVRSLLLPSRPLVQKLIDTLGWRAAAATREMREDAACIVAHLAGDIHLSQFPGAIRCISTLLQDETTLTYWWNCDQKQGHTHLRTGSRSTMHTCINIIEFLMLEAREQEVNRQGGDDDGQHKKHVIDEGGGGCNELIFQGLTILERLASDQHNCMDICRNQSLLPRIMAPLCSNTLLQGAKTSAAWADVVNGCFKVLCRLIRCPGWTGKSLRREIATNEQAISNLEGILDQSSEAGQELQMRAMEILTELALDSSTNLTMETKENLMKKQLEIFLAEESDALSKELNATEGRTLKFLTANSELISSVVKDNFCRLTELLDAKNNTTYRIIAAQILENICARCDVDKECVKDTLLPQILTGIQSKKREPPQSSEENQKNNAPVDDEENQNNAPGNNDENDNISAQEGNTEIQETFSKKDQTKSSDQGDDEQPETKELQEAFLSLTLVIYDSLISIDEFDDAVQKNSLGNGEFVAKLKTIVEDNCKETVVSLRIVKLCGQIAATMMKHKQYTEHFKNRGFAESLSKATKTMSNLESCILFAGTELRLKKAATPLLSEIEKELKSE